MSDTITVHHFETAVDRFTDESPNLDDLNGDWMSCYAILASPELIPLDGTTRDQIRVFKCEAGHLHLPEQLVWTGPIAPIGFAEIWERKANLTGEPLARIKAMIKVLPPGDSLTMGPGRLT